MPATTSMTGAGEAPPNNSVAKGRMTGVFDTDNNTLEWTVTYSGLSSPPIGAHLHGPVSDLGLTEIAPIQVGTPGNPASPFHGVAKIDDTQAKDLKDGRWVSVGPHRACDVGVGGRSRGKRRGRGGGQAHLSDDLPQVPCSAALYRANRRGESAEIPG